MLRSLSKRSKSFLNINCMTLFAKEIFIFKCLNERTWNKLKSFYINLALHRLVEEIFVFMVQDKKSQKPRLKITAYINQQCY